MSTSDGIAEGATPQLVEIEGQLCLQEALRTRQFLALLKVFTMGLGGQLDAILSVASAEDQETFGQEMLGIMFVAIPEAEEEFIEFVRRLVTPVFETETGVMPLEGEELAAWELRMKNPDLDTLTIVIGGLLVQYHDEFLELLGKVRTQAMRLKQFGSRGRSKTTAATSG